MTPAREALRRLAAEGALTMFRVGRISTPDLSNERNRELPRYVALSRSSRQSCLAPCPHLALMTGMQAITMPISDAGEQCATREIKIRYEPRISPHVVICRAQAPRCSRCRDRLGSDGPTDARALWPAATDRAAAFSKLEYRSPRAGDEPGLRWRCVRLSKAWPGCWCVRPAGAA